MPRYIQPAGGMPDAPSNSTLIQIGFNYQLNYPFVVNTDGSASQIFTYLPEGLAHALDLDQSKVVMAGLMPFDTTATLDYITTLAQAYVPKNLVSQLAQMMHNPNSAFYVQPEDTTVQTLMSMINPAIPLIPGANMNGGSHTQRPADAQATSGAGGVNGDGAPIGGDSGASQSIKGSSVGIGVGAVAGAAVYAAAMVYVARRYRKKKASHKRASSIPTAGEMSQRSTGQLSGGGMGSYFITGANGRRSSPTAGIMGSSRGTGSRNSSGSSNNGRSVRDAGISAPMMAENSLGWN